MQENSTGYFKNSMEMGKCPNGSSADPAVAASAALAHYRATQRDLIPYLQIDGQYINEKHALVAVRKRTCTLAGFTMRRFADMPTAC